MIESKLTKHQLKTFTREFMEDGQKYRIICNIRHDDNCGNGHNTFSITGSIDEFRGGRFREHSCGSVHDDIVKHFPEFRDLIKWHLTSTDGPMHYLANTIYLAGNRDHHGLLKDEKRQIKNGKTGLPCWHMVAVDKKTGDEKEFYEIEKSVDSLEKPECDYTLEYRPWCRIGEGKERELDAARSAAIWPDATDAELSVDTEELKKKLIERLPALMKEFKSSVESIGMEY